MKCPDEETGMYRFDDWLLTPDGAAIHAGERTAVIADVHLGYEWARGAAGDCIVAHSLAETTERLSRVLGGETTRGLVAFDGERCDRATPDDWVTVPASDRLWATERDGDVVLTTTGDGLFQRVTGH